VTTKADSKFKIVGAASVAAKVTRDACVEGWCFEESEDKEELTWGAELGSGYPSGTFTSEALRGISASKFFFRSKYPGLAKDCNRSRIWISKNRTLFLDNSKGDLGEKRTFGQMVSGRWG